MNRYDFENDMTVNDIIDMCEMSGWKMFRLDMPNGHFLYITPCSTYPQVTKENVEFFLVDGQMPWMGENTIEKLLDALKNYERSLDEHERDCERLRDYYEKNIRGKNPTDEQLDFYSDWHKDLYGRRPRLR